MRVHSLTLAFTFKLSFLAHNLASPYLGREPKARVATKKLTKEEEDLIFEIELAMFSIGIIIISKETILLLSIGKFEIKMNAERKPHGTLDQGTL